jgi:hypothetical protein
MTNETKKMGSKTPQMPVALEQLHIPCCGQIWPDLSPTLAHSVQPPTSHSMQKTPAQAVASRTLPLGPVGLHSPLLRTADEAANARLAPELLPRQYRKYNPSQLAAVNRASVYSMLW